MAGTASLEARKTLSGNPETGIRVAGWVTAVFLGFPLSRANVRIMPYPFKTEWLLYVPPSLTYKNTTYFPHKALMAFVWLWERQPVLSYTVLMVWLLYQEGVFATKYGPNIGI